MEEITFSLGDTLGLTLTVDRIRFGLSPAALFSLAVRDNMKRPFLFVSRVLGKHLPIRPETLIAAGRLLALALTDSESPGIWADILCGNVDVPFDALMKTFDMERIYLESRASTLFVGFAETATGLARAVADCFTGACGYISTTRSPIAERAPLRFEESHSHARNHLLHLNAEEAKGFERAVIIDDEFTTGRTALKLVEALNKNFGIKRFVLLSLLDWTESGERLALSESLGVEIKQTSLMQGSIVEVRKGTLPRNSLDDWTGYSSLPHEIQTVSRGLPMGRTLLIPSVQAEGRGGCKRIAERIGRASPKTLVLGTGELIYEPALIAGYCGAKAFHSTTQSPVFPLQCSGVESGVRFSPPDLYSKAGYLYNVPLGGYERALVFTETDTMRREGLYELSAWLKSRGCERVEVFAL